MAGPVVHKFNGSNLSPALLHGGRLNAAVGRYGIPLEQWLDLSTGINPNGWPVPALPAEVFSRLPEEDDGLQQVAVEYYGSRDLLLIPGSQAAIQMLPQCFLEQRGRALVGVLNPAYAEHGYRWQLQGHQLQPLSVDEVDAFIDELDAVVLINPCNPSGVSFSAEQLRDWHARLASRGGWLLVDEAFIDVTPELSLITDPMPEGLIVLRSLGKFFGLAGLRVGAVCAHIDLLQLLSHKLGPWAISHPARYIARQALADRAWQQKMRAGLREQQARLQALLARDLSEPVITTALFATVITERAQLIEHRCAEAGILIRRFEQPAALRFGLPGNEQEWQRLEKVLNEIR